MNTQTPYVIYPPEPQRKPEKSSGLHSLIAGAQLPLFQAAVSGLFAAALVTFLAVKWMWLDPLSYGFVAGLLVAGLVWALQIINWSRIAWYIERSTGIDLPGSYAAPADPEPERIRLEVTDRNATVFLDLDCSLETIQRFARNALAGRLSEKDNARLFGSLEQWIAVRDELERRGMVAWVSSSARQRGIRLTPQGLKMLRSLLSSPSPLSDDNLESD